MTENPNVVVDSPDRLAAVLEATLAAAHENGIDVEGGWLIESSSDTPDWDIEIWEVAERSDSN